MTGLHEGCPHKRTKLVIYSYPATSASGWTTITFKQCQRCGEEAKGSRKEKFSKKKPIRKKK